MSLADLNLDAVRIVIMIILIVAFLGMWAWAWSSRRKQTFDRASMLPLEEDNGQVPPENERLREKQGKHKQEGIEE
jgi:cytochrome c oxidase cbb3-type subunit 4